MGWMQELSSLNLRDRGHEFQFGNERGGRGTWEGRICGVLHGPDLLPCQPAKHRTHKTHFWECESSREAEHKGKHIKIALQ